MPLSTPLPGMPAPHTILADAALAPWWPAWVLRLAPPPSGRGGLLSASVRQVRVRIRPSPKLRSATLWFGASYCISLNVSLPSCLNGSVVALKRSVCMGIKWETYMKHLAWWRSPGISFQKILAEEKKLLSAGTGVPRVINNPIIVVFLMNNPAFFSHYCSQWCLSHFTRGSESPGEGDGSKGGSLRIPLCLYFHFLTTQMLICFSDVKA